MIHCNKMANIYVYLFLILVYLTSSAISSESKDNTKRKIKSVRIPSIIGKNGSNSKRMQLIGSNENGTGHSHEYQWCQDTNTKFGTLLPPENYDSIECSWIREDKDN